MYMCIACSYLKIDNSHICKNSDIKFDIKKKILPIIYDKKTLGNRLKFIRIKNKTSMDELCNNIPISTTTLALLEKDGVSDLYKYFYSKKICDYFSEDYIQIGELYSLPEKNYIDKLYKIRAYLGVRSWKGVATELNYSSAFIIDLLSREYIANKNNIERIDNLLKKLKGGN